MASHNALRQVSRIIQNNKSHLNPSRTRQYSSTSLFTSSHISRIRAAHPHQKQSWNQTRALSLWGSSGSTPSTTPPASNAPQSDLLIKDPTDLDRTIKASSDISADSTFQSSTTSQDPLDSLANTPSQPALETIPERIGYLHDDCGLDFGWGPTSTMSWVLEHIHIWGGLSWTASIVCLGIGLRTIMFPALVMAADQTARMRSISKSQKALREQLTAAQAVGDQARMQELQFTMRNEMVASGFSMKKAFLPMLIQVPFGFGAWRILRNAAHLPVPGFVTESWLWTNDLTFSDPYFVMPLLSGGLIWLTLRINRNARQGSAGVAGQGGMELLMKIMPLMSTVFMVFQPGAVQLYFTSSTATGLVTAWMLQKNLVRKTFGLPTLTELAEMSGETEANKESTVKQAGGAAQNVASHAAASGMRTRRKNDSMILEAKARVIEEDKAKQDRVSRSIIDRGVDKAKASFEGISKNANDMIEGIAGKSVDPATKERRSKAEQWEARRKREDYSRYNEQSRR